MPYLVLQRTFCQCFAAYIHADPHPGNVLLTCDEQIALIDLGWRQRRSIDK
ncbi:MAG: hypothetical protein K2X93_20640 [Candidatus Obscuribacterales bacterium]|nr:hypothetical protein [Candidatus Obscuribacterales bacterium]